MSLSVHCPVGARHNYESRTTMVAATPVKYLLQQYKKLSSYLLIKINLSQFVRRSPLNCWTHFCPFLRLSKYILAQIVKTTNEITHFRKYWGSQNGKSASSLCVIPGGHKCGCVVPTCSHCFHSSTIYSALRTLSNRTLDILWSDAM